LATGALNMWYPEDWTETNRIHCIQVKQPTNRGSVKNQHVRRVL